MTDTLEIHAIREAHEASLVAHYRALVDGRRETAFFELGQSEGLARALGELEAVEPLEIHVRAVAAITARSEEGRELVERAREALRANLAG